jgi:hypothetical protein
MEGSRKMSGWIYVGQGAVATWLQDPPRCSLKREQMFQ